PRTTVVTPSGLVILTSAGPTPRAGVVTVRVVAVGVPAGSAGLPPMNTRLSVWKPRPEIVTTVPPAGGPELGLMAVITGAGARAKKMPSRTTCWPSGLTILTSAGPGDGSVGTITVRVVAVWVPLNVARTLLKN